MPSTKFQPTLRFAADQLTFRYPFRIAHGVRTSTDVVLVKLIEGSSFGLGEATLPPYLPWKSTDIINLLRGLVVTIELESGHPKWSTNNRDLLDCPPALAAIDMAVWNLCAELKGRNLREYLDYPAANTPHTFTLGISEKSEMAEKIAFARDQGFGLFKLKMDAEHRINMFDNFKALCDDPFAVDANQGWSPNEESIDFAKLLQQNNCVLIEQPFDRQNHEAHGALRDHLHIPVIADESIQHLGDLMAYGRFYDGINIKLQKCGGITPAIRMIEACQPFGTKILIGCMSESAIGCNSAEALSGRADWADLDGPWLISNNEPIVQRASEL
jgi:L-Ala-D/L-Glu epimerase